jgi:tRNA-specific 2-thiouridylase
VRALASARRLPVAGKADSQEICFVSNDDYAAVVEQRATTPIRPGAVVDSAGRTLGRHHGIHHFTVGQRKGLGISAPAPLYVIRIDALTQTVVVGAKDELQGKALLAAGVNWIAGSDPAGAFRADAQIRYHHAPAAATVEPLGAGRARVAFDLPQSAITPGQAVVFYREDEVVGGGWIEQSLPE